MPHPFLGLGFNSWSQKFSRGNVPAAVAALLEYVTTSSTSSFTLLSTGTVDYEVDWGDGTTESLTTNNPTHTYSSAGEYTIKVTPVEGSTYYPFFNDAVSDTSIASVSGAGGSQLGTSLLESWEGASNMTSFSSDIDTSSVTNFNYAWSNCTGLTSFPLLNTSSGTNFSSTWQSCSGLTSFPQLDTSSSTSFYSTWRNCTGLTSFPLLNTSSGTNFTSAWTGCSGLTSFPQLDTSSSTSFSTAWRDCTGLTSFPQLDTSSGTFFSYTWYNCDGLTSFPLLNTSSGTSFSNTWNGCTGLTSFPQLDVSSGTNFSSSWRNCPGLTSFPLLNTSSGTNFTYTWAYCYGLASFPQLDVSSGTNFGSAWKGCYYLSSFPANMFDTTGTLVSTAFDGAFNDCLLTAQSIENILVSLDTNGASNITLGISGEGNAGYSTWSSTAQTALTNLQGKGWTISYNA
jgi:hypothetical protein